MGVPTDEDIRKMLKALCAPPVQVFPAIVDAVNESEYTIGVTTMGGSQLFDVRLKAGIDEVTDGAVELPVVGTPVLIGIIGNDKETAFLIKTSSVQVMILNGGTNGGLVNIEALQTLLTQLMTAINELKVATETALNAQGTAMSALEPAATAFTTAAALIQEELSFEGLEDTKVTH